MNKSIFYIIILIAGLLVIGNIYQKKGYAPDDTYIYLQYAKNIAAGNGFSFNPGEESYGVTSPLWVLVLTLPNVAGINAYWFSKFADLLCAFISIFLFFRLASFFFKDNLMRYAATAIFILNAWFVRWAFTGMECSLAVMLVVWIFLLYYTQKYKGMFFLLGLFYLTRPEGFVLFLVLSSVILFNGIKQKDLKLLQFVKYILLTAIPVLIFLIYAKISFGTFIPNTALGKSTFTLNPAVFIEQIKEISKTLAGAGLVELLLTAVFVLFAIKKKSFQQTAPLFLWIAALVLLYIVTDADIISRYLLIVSPFFIIIGLKSIENLKFNQKYVIIAVILLSVFYSQFIFYKFVKPSTDDFTKGVNECFIPIADWLKQNSDPKAKILLNDVGAVGYYSNRYIIDAAALVNRDLALNKEIMSAPLEDRMETHKLLKFIEADYVIDRDSSETSNVTEFGKYGLQLQLTKKFPSLGISDPTPRYYKIYKVIKAGK
ncbi:MAG: hypothetical protein ABI543_01370 [Ignavibacteria bacterium]